MQEPTPNPEQEPVAPPAPVAPPTPEWGMQGPAPPTGGFPLPVDPEWLVHVGSYLGAAAMGGVIGNRADAGVIAIATRTFHAVRDRWLRRGGPAASARISRDEAVDAAAAASITQGYDPNRIFITEAQEDGTGGWTVFLNAPRLQTHQVDRLRVRVPPGDPGAATILITPER